MEYTSTIEDISETKKQVKVVIPSELYSAEVQKSMNSVAAKVSIKGFRPGKAPRQLIEKMYGESVRIETIDKLINESLKDLVKKNSYSILGDPKVELQEAELGKAIEYTASFSIFPKPEVSNYDSFDITVEKREASDEEVEHVVQSVRRSKASLSKVEDREAVQDGDVVEGEVVATVEGAEAPGSSEPFYIKVGEGRVPAVLEEGLRGMKIGETKEVESSISEEHPREEMRGKKIFYRLTVRGISQEILPELTDAFVKELEGKEETVLELKMGIRDRVNNDYEQSAKEQVKSKIIEKLVSEHTFEVPQELIDDEIKTLVEQQRRGGGEGAAIDPAAYREQHGEEARRRVVAAILIDRIAEKESLHAKAEDIERYMSDTAAAYGVTPDEVRKYFSKEGRLVNVFIEMTRHNVLEFLANRAKVTYAATAAEQ